jgi:hypothetical protein
LIILIGSNPLKVMDVLPAMKRAVLAHEVLREKIFQQ